VSSALRIALFADSYYEANGVARTCAALEAYAARRDLPLMLVHAGPSAAVIRTGSVTRVELRRARLTSCALEHDLAFDFTLVRHARRVRRELHRFAPDVVHFTGPSDVGQLGVWLARRSRMPMVGSWHTNLHEYASRRLRLEGLPESWGAKVRDLVEQQTLRWSLRFYRLPQVVLAPNEDLRRMLAPAGRPTFLMSRGVDTVAFTPQRRKRTDGAVNIGYVGRLSPEKSVRVLADLEQAFRDRGVTGVRFTIVGEGCERPWLADRMRRAAFTGVLRGDALADAYANMDLFVFPSETETVGNVVLEAMASGVPVIAMASGGPRFVVGDSPAVLLARSAGELIDTAGTLVRDSVRRRTMAAAARAWALEHSWDQIFDNVYRAYAVAASLVDRTQPEAVPESLAPTLE